MAVDLVEIGQYMHACGEGIGLTPQNGNLVNEKKKKKGYNPAKC